MFSSCLSSCVLISTHFEDVYCFAIYIFLLGLLMNIIQYIQKKSNKLSLFSIPCFLHQSLLLNYTHRPLRNPLYLSIIFPLFFFSFLLSPFFLGLFITSILYSV